MKSNSYFVDGPFDYEVICDGITYVIRFCIDESWFVFRIDETANKVVYPVN